MTVIISGTDGVSDIDGSAGTPAIRGTDANTGIFFGADQVGVATNGVERAEFGNSETVFNDGGASVDFRVEGDTDANLLFVDASADKVGIGTSSPPQKFVVSNAGADNIVMCENSSASIQMFMQATASIGTVGTLTNQAIGFLTNNTERARITSDGDLTVSRQIGSRNGSGFGVFRASSNVTVANGATITLSGGSAAQIICVGCENSGTGAAFFANFNTTVSQIGGSATSISTSDSGTVDIAVFKNSSDNTVTFKNRSGGTKGYTIAMFCGTNGSAN